MGTIILLFKCPTNCPHGVRFSITNVEFDFRLRMQLPSSTQQSLELCITLSSILPRESIFPLVEIPTSIPEKR